MIDEIEMNVIINDPNFSNVCVIFFILINQFRYIDIKLGIIWILIIDNNSISCNDFSYLLSKNLGDLMVEIKS